MICTLCTQIQVGSPWACTAVFDGVDSYVDLGLWNPGPIYSIEVWVRALTVQTSGRQVWCVIT